MKILKKSRVSWPSDSMLCQVKMFQTEDCPAKVGTQSCSKPEASNLPPGYQGTEYSTRLNISHIPRIRWKRPPKFILLLQVVKTACIVTRSENLRIAKVLEAFYPHRSLIPTRPSISPAVEVESYDDSKTLNIRLTSIEDENEPEAVAVESSHSSKAPPSVLGLGPDLSLAASAALSAFMKTKEQVSLIDADLLVKFLSDPIIIKKLLNDTTAANPLEPGNNILNTTKPPPQHVSTSSAMDRNSPPKPTITHPGNGVPHIVPVLATQSIVSHVPTQPPVSCAPLVLHTYPLSSALKPLPRVEDSLKPSSVDDVGVSEPQCQSLNVSTSSTWNMSSVLESVQTGTDAPNRNGSYPMNITRDDYFKNLIREHGGVTPATNGTNKYKGRVDNNNNNIKAVKVKVQKPCMFFGRGRGCKLGESCLYLHDPSKRLWTDVAAPEFPRAKRLKFRT